MALAEERSRQILIKNPTYDPRGAIWNEDASVSQRRSSVSVASVYRDRERENTPPVPHGGEMGIHRNVSFIQGCEESTAYHEHNPPSVLRKSLTQEFEMPAVRPKPFKDLQKQDELHILIAVTGSVATIKLPLIVRQLKQIYRKRAVIQVMVTRASVTFLDLEELPKDVKVWHDENEWNSRKVGKADSSLHVQLRRWADVLLVAPCSANTLAKFAYGICDNLITSVFRVWNPALPLLIAPAMNTLMYTNPVTKRHLLTMKELFPFVEILKPVEKVLVCGDMGLGGMREWTDIVQTLVTRLGGPPEDEDDTDDDDEDEDADDRDQQKVVVDANSSKTL